MQKILKMVLVVSLMIPLSGCSLLGGNSDYDSHVRGRVEFKQSDDTRIAAQAQAIADMATSRTETAEGAAFQKALGMITIALLKNQEYSEKAPMTMTEGVVRVAEVAVPFAAIGYSTVQLGREISRAAGDVSIGAGSTVSGSFNKPSAVSIGEGSALASPGVEVVKPEVVNPVIVEPGV
jgi:hypothetical protein